MTNILIKNATVKEINQALLRLQGADSNSGTTTNVNVRSSSSSSGGSSVNLSGVYSKIQTNAKNIASNTSSISLINTKLTEDEKSIKANTTNITKNTNNIASNSSKIGSIIGILSTDLYTLSAGDTTLALKNNYTLTEQEVTVPYATAALNDSDGNAINDTYLKLTGGILTGDLTVNGNIYQNGSSYITHAEHLYSKDDLILTRDGATTGLSSGTYTGIKALLYDGTNNGYLVFDNSGTAMVGDEGSLVPLQARDTEANMSDGKLVYWDATNKILKTSTGTTTTYLPLAGGTMTGTISSMDIVPKQNATYNLGSSTYKYSSVYATSFIGNASTQTKLQTQRTIQTNLQSTSSASFDGTANITPGVTGTLPIQNGGTGGTTQKAQQYNLLSNMNQLTTAYGDGSLIVGAYADATTTSGAVYNRTALSMYNYIKGKTDDVYLKLAGGTLTGDLTQPNVQAVNNGYEKINCAFNNGAGATTYIYLGYLGYNYLGNKVVLNCSFYGGFIVDKMEIKLAGWPYGADKPGIEIVGQRWMGSAGFTGVYYNVGSSWNSNIDIWVGVKQLDNSNYTLSVVSEYDRGSDFVISDGSTRTTTNSFSGSAKPYNYEKGPWTATSIDATSHGIVPQTDNTYSLGTVSNRYNAVNAIQLRAYAGNSGNSGTWCQGQSITTAVDGGAGYILLQPITGSNSSGKLPKCGFEGRIYLNRGSPSALNISGWMDICAVVAYNERTVWARYNNSEASYITAIRQVLYNGTYYVAIQTNASLWSQTLEGCFFNNDNCTLTSIAQSAITSYIDLQTPQQYETSGTAYLPLTGGTLSGQLTGTTATFTTVNAALNGNQSTASQPLGGYSITGCQLPYAWSYSYIALTDTANYKTSLGSVFSGSTWYNVLSIRHRNGTLDGNKYGLLIYNKMTQEGSLQYQQQVNGTWTSQKTILDSSNYTTYTGKYLPLTGGTMTGQLTGTTQTFTTVNATTVNATTLSTTSARKYKKNIKEWKQNALDLIDKVNVVEYKYKSENDSNEKHIGFIADDTDKLLSGEKQDKMRIQDSIGVLIKAVQELKQLYTNIIDK